MKNRDKARQSTDDPLLCHSNTASYVRLATVADAKLIASQRRQMFTENGLIFQGDWDEFERAFAAWVAPRLLNQSYIGWLAEEAAGVVAGAGLWLMEWPPHYRHIEPVRGYLLNFYTVPECRGKGLAKQLISLAVGECRARRVSLAVLHATKMGEPVYRQVGFQAGNEMTLSVGA